MVRDPTELSWKGARKIRDILLEKDATWSDLQRETRLSHDILSRYLRKFQEEGIAFKGQINGKYSSYERADQSFAHQLDESIVVSDQILFVKDFLVRKQPSEDTKAFLAQAIRASAMLLTASIPAIIYNSLRNYRIAEKRGLDLSTLGSDEMIDIFIRPWIHNLLDLCLLDKELGERIAIEISDSIYGPAFTEYEKYIETLDKFL